MKSSEQQEHHSTSASRTLRLGSDCYNLITFAWNDHHWPLEQEHEKIWTDVRAFSFHSQGKSSIAGSTFWIFILLIEVRRLLRSMGISVCLYLSDPLSHASAHGHRQSSHVRITTLRQTGRALVHCELNHDCLAYATT